MVEFGKVDGTFGAILSIARDLTTSVSSVDRYARLLSTVRQILRSDAATLMRKEGDTLRVLASEGMRANSLKRGYSIQQHPRLKIISESQVSVLFPADSPLPDPFDQCLEKNHGDHIRVHSCLGCPLLVDGELVGVLSADSVAIGAFDTIDHDFLSMLGALAGATLRTSQLIDALEQTAEKRGLVARDLMKSVTESVGSFLLGTTSAMEKLREEIEFAAQCDLSVLISGETGTGKELVARSIQGHSGRRNDAMIYVNCAALPENIVESELFGHVRGAFTGAHSNRAGKFEVADGGTIFLDEVGEIPLQVQAKLLRVLQEGEIQRVGSDQFMKVNVRVIAATNRNLQEEAQAGRFRSDLYYRLNVYPIRVPPLRDHRDDIPYLVGHFCDLNQRKLSVTGNRVHAQGLGLLREYPWPGNVRELKNVIDRTVLRAKFKRPQSENFEIVASDLPADLHEGPSGRVLLEAALAEEGVLPKLREATDEFQRKLIQRAVQDAQGNWAKGAQALGLHRSNLFVLRKRLGLK
jgi:anaerobic nitric oxide reductase transcription regulator